MDALSSLEVRPGLLVEELVYDNDSNDWFETEEFRSIVMPEGATCVPTTNGVHTTCSNDALLRPDDPAAR